MAGRVVMDRGAIHALLTGPTGPVGVDLMRRLYRITAGAKRRCPVNKEIGFGGRLRDSIRPSMRTDAFGLVGIVGSDVEYALYVHEGTRSHVISSTGPWPLRNPRSGQVFGHVVTHPGTTAVPFLREALIKDGS